MQVSSNEQCRYIGCGEVKKESATYYYINLADEYGETMRAFADQQAFYTAKGLSFGDPIKVTWDIYSGRNGLGVRLKGIVKEDDFL